MIEMIVKCSQDALFVGTPSRAGAHGLWVTQLYVSGWRQPSFLLNNRYTYSTFPNAAFPWTYTKPPQGLIT